MSLNWSGVFSRPRVCTASWNPPGDVLLEVSRKLGKPLNLPWMTFDEMVGATFMALPAPSADVDAWTDAQTKGFWTGAVPAGLAAAGASAKRASSTF